MKRILVALDSSTRAPVVLAAAVKLARLAGARLVLFRAVGVPPEMPRELFTMTDTPLEEFLLANARNDLKRLAADVPPQMIEATIAGFATAWDGICSTGRVRDADLIVIGSHGFGGIDRLLGTTAAKVVNHSDRNVMVIRTTL